MSLYDRIVRGPLGEDQLDESVFDKNILKAVFLGGGMGVGKSWVAMQMFGSREQQRRHTSIVRLGGTFGLKTLSVDEIFTFHAKQLGLNPKTAFSLPPEGDVFDSRGREVHDAAWYKMMKQRGLFTRGRLGLLIDGTAKDPAYILRGKKILEALGYDCSMVMVKATLGVATLRNLSRGRTVDELDLKASHAAVEAAGQVYQREFGRNYYEIRNDETFDADAIKRGDVGRRFHKLATKILKKPLKNPTGHKWIAREMEGAPLHMKKQVWREVGVRYEPSAVEKLAAIGRRS